MEYVYITGTFPAKQACTISVPSEVNLGSIPASDLHPGRPANDFRKTFTVNSNCGGGTAKIALTTPIIANGCPATSAGMLFCLDNDGNKIDMSVSGGDIYIPDANESSITLGVTPEVIDKIAPGTYSVPLTLTITIE